jgi:hypothetical protein
VVCECLLSRCPLGVQKTTEGVRSEGHVQDLKPHTRAIFKVRGLAAVRRCYAEECGEYYAKL